MTLGLVDFLVTAQAVVAVTAMPETVTVAVVTMTAVATAIAVASDTVGAFAPFLPFIDALIPPPQTQAYHPLDA